MKKTITVKMPASKFSKEYEMQYGNFTIVKGDIIKIDGQHGMRFKFDCITTNTETGMKWVDCFEYHKVSSGVQRSFALESVKRIPVKRGRKKKNVN